MELNEIEKLYIDYENGKSLNKLAIENDINRTTLTQLFIKHCGYESRSRRQHKNLVNDYYVDLYYKEYTNTNISQTEFSKKHSLCRQCLSDKFKEKYPSVKTRKGNKLEINSYAFSNLNADSAYWLGVMLTDGYISKDNEMSLCLKDKEHIQKFKSFLCSSHKVGKKEIMINNKICKAYRISFKDSTIYSDLNNLGCYNNKSFTVRLPNIDNNLSSHLIRGIFDGDGSTSNKSKTTSNNISIVSANQDFLKDIQIVLERNKINVTRIFKSRNLYTLNISVKKENIKNFHNYIYKDSHEYNRLDRKYLSVKKMLNLPS